jgi:hypothetical protein
MLWRLDLDHPAPLPSPFHRKNTAPSPLSFPTVLVFTIVMKRAFVLRLTPEARPMNGMFQGRVEEVDSGRNVKFGSIEEFVDFLQQCLDHQQTPDE